MKRILWNIALALFIAASTQVTSTGYAVTFNPDGFEVGGSNFVLYHLTTYPDDIPYVTPLVLRPVIGTLQYDPDRVKAELNVMKSRGQKKIALVIYHQDMIQNSGYDGVVNGLNISSGTRRLAPQQEENLSVLLEDIKEIGFEEVQVRFAPQAGSHPANWSVWEETIYQHNWNFIVHTRAQVEAALAGTNIRRVYDLGVALGGKTAGQIPAYEQRLWTNYLTLSADDSYGFSIGFGKTIGTGAGKATAMINTLKSTGTLPASYGFNVYGDQLAALQQIMGELSALGEASKPIVIQEAPYNDANSYTNILAGRNTTGLNIRTIIQWPIMAGSDTGNFFPGLDFPAEYRNYNPFQPGAINGAVE